VPSQSGPPPGGPPPPQGYNGWVLEPVRGNRDRVQRDGGIVKVTANIPKTTVISCRAFGLPTDISQTPANATAKKRYRRQNQNRKAGPPHHDAPLFFRAIAALMVLLSFFSFFSFSSPFWMGFRESLCRFPSFVTVGQPGSMAGR